MCQFRVHGNSPVCTSRSRTLALLPASCQVNSDLRRARVTAYHNRPFQNLYILSLGFTTKVILGELVMCFCWFASVLRLCVFPFHVFPFMYLVIVFTIEFIMCAHVIGCCQDITDPVDYAVNENSLTWQRVWYSAIGK